METPLHAIFFAPPIDDWYIGNQAEEIYKDRIYDPYLVGKKDLTIIDVGANLGLASYRFASFAKAVYAFEPSALAFSCLKAMVDYNKLTNVIPLNMAIANTDGEMPLYHSLNKTMNSLMPAVANMPGLSDTKDPQEIVKTIRLDTFFKERGIEKVDLLKLDCEGFEVDLLCGEAFQAVAPKIDLIIGETHSWSNRNPQQFKDALNNAGFTMQKIEGQAELFAARKI